MIFRLKSYLSVLVIFLGLQTKAYAYDFILGIGNLSEYISVLQDNTNKTKSPFYFNPYLDIKVDYDLKDYAKDFYFSPELGITLPQNDPDPNTRHLKFFTLLNIKYIKENNYLLFGGGLFFTRIWGDLGEEELNNGTSTTAFPLPDRVTLSRNAVVNLGLGHQFTNHLNLELHTIIFNIESSEDRSFSVGANISYHFGEIN